MSATSTRILDVEKNAMQRQGYCSVLRLSVADALEIVTDIGLDPRDVVIISGNLVSVDPRPTEADRG